MQQVENVEFGFAEEEVGALVLQFEQRALYGTHTLGGDVAVGRGVLGGILRHVVEHRTEVFQVEEEQVPVVGNAEDDVQDAGLGVVQTHQAGQQLRTHARNGGADGVSLLAVNVEKADRTGLEFRIWNAEGIFAFFDKAA